MKEIITNLVIVVFPILVYFIYSVNEKSLELKENNLFFEFCVISSIYLLLNISKTNYLYLNSFLIICYLKNKKIFSLLISIIIIISYSFININLLPIYLLIYISYYIYYKKNIDFLPLIITIISSILFLSMSDNIINLLSVILFVLLNYILIKLIKKLDEIFKMYISLEEAHNDKLISSTLFKITHEIKNPLSVCKGYLDMYDINNTSQSKKYIPILKEEIDRTLVILNDFLCISKLKVDLDILDINMLLEQTLDNVNILFKKNKIKTDINLLKDEVFINGDYNRLIQVFMNIIKNSVESIEKNGVIELSDYIENNNIVILLKDNGIGIDDIERIKEPFYTTKTNGTGLGVPLSIEIIKKHNGTIEYESNKSGTLVTIKLPIISFNNC